MEQLIDRAKFEEGVLSKKQSCKLRFWVFIAKVAKKVHWGWLKRKAKNKLFYIAYGGGRKVHSGAMVAVFRHLYGGKQ